MRADLFLKRPETMETRETARLCRILVLLPREPGGARAAWGGEGAPVPARQGLPASGEKRPADSCGSRERAWEAKRVSCCKMVLETQNP